MQNAFTSFKAEHYSMQNATHSQCCCSRSPRRTPMQGADETCYECNGAEKRDEARQMGPRQSTVSARERVRARDPSTQCACALILAQPLVARLLLCVGCSILISHSLSLSYDRIPLRRIPRATGRPRQKNQHTKGNDRKFATFWTPGTCSPGRKDHDHVSCLRRRAPICEHARGRGWSMTSRTRRLNKQRRDGLNRRLKRKSL